MNSLKKIVITNLVIFLSVFYIHSESHADEVLWKSGLNFHIKIVKQDKSSGAPIPNQHPVTLNAKQIINALNLFKIWTKKFLEDDEIRTVFSIQQSRLLGQYLSEGFRKANTGEDIVFALSRLESGFLGIKKRVYMGGRAFYLNNRLNIIIGDFDKPGDKFLERVYASSGADEPRYYLAHGRRAKASKFDESIIVIEGIDVYKAGPKVRHDWFVINIEKASTTYLAQKSGNKQPVNRASDEAIRIEAAKLAQERRQMRLEMARLRKEMNQTKNNNSSSVEERLRRLDDLKNKELISKDEYATKREEILNEI